MRFWNGWHGPDDWGWGPLSAEQNERFRALRQLLRGARGFAVGNPDGCVRGAKRSVPDDRIMEIRYEELCADPVDIRARGRANSRSSTSRRAWSVSIGNFSLRSQNDKWKQGPEPRSAGAR